MPRGPQQTWPLVTTIRTFLRDGANINRIQGESRSNFRSSLRREFFSNKSSKTATDIRSLEHQQKGWELVDNAGNRFVPNRFNLTFPPLCSERQEFTLGATLGKGAYCYVSEITAISLTRDQKNEDIEGTASSPDKPNSKSDTTSENDIALDETEFPVGMFRNTDEMRKYMSEYCLREDDEGKHSRYALKQLKPTNDHDKLEQGLIDIAIEAKFLSYISHPNIIKMRGTAGEPLSPHFALVLDRLYMTLHEQMHQWAADKTDATSSRRGLCGCSFGTVDSQAIAKLFFSAVTVAYDLSCALRHIHSCKWVVNDAFFLIIILLRQFFYSIWTPSKIFGIFTISAKSCTSIY